VLLVDSLARLSTQISNIYSDISPTKD
jgi:hypothetical protein